MIISRRAPSILSGHASAPSKMNDAGIDVLRPTPLTLHIDWPARIITVRGEVDLYSSPSLQKAMSRLVQAHPGNTTVDLHRVDFLDATGLTCLVELNNALGPSGDRLTVIAPPRLRRLFAITGLEDLLAEQVTEPVGA
jgi:anti-sigma B factor antagonist